MSTTTMMTMTVTSSLSLHVKIKIRALSISSISLKFSLTGIRVDNCRWPTVAAFSLQPKAIQQSSVELTSKTLRKSQISPLQFATQLIPPSFSLYSEYLMSKIEASARKLLDSFPGGRSRASCAETQLPRRLIAKNRCEKERGRGKEERREENKSPARDIVLSAGCRE